MHTYHLIFADGKTCTMLDPDEEGLVPCNFKPGYLVSMTRVIAAAPTKLPWVRDGQVWRIGSFELTRLEAGLFRVTWTGGSSEGGKDEVSAAVRENWTSGILSS